MPRLVSSSDEQAVASSWWGPTLALAPLAAFCAALTGGLALYRVASLTHFNARELVGTAGVSYIVASGCVLLGPWLLLSGIVASSFWSAAGSKSGGIWRQLSTWLSVVVAITTLLRCLQLWVTLDEPLPSRIVLETRSSFCGQVVLVSDNRLYVAVDIREPGASARTPSATSIASDRVVAISAMATPRCRDFVTPDDLAEK